MRKSWTEGLGRVIERFVPDALTTAVLMLVGLFLLSLAVGGTVKETTDAWYRGLWMLLPFTMQMTLILLLSLILAATPLFRGVVLRLSRLPKTAAQVVIASSLLSGAISYLNWGLAMALGPMIAIHFAKEAERKGIRVDFLFLLATLGGVGSIWQFGFSASAPLLMATEGHFLKEETGVMSLQSTIWSPAAVIHVLVFTAAAIALGCWLMPAKTRQISEFPESDKIAEAALNDEVASSEPSPDQPPLAFARRLEHTPLVIVPLCLALAGWLYYHFFEKGLSLDINSFNTILLLLCLTLHRTVHRFTEALQEAIRSVWPIVVMYHLYAGVAGLIQFTPLGAFLVQLLDPLSTRYTYSLLTALTSTVVAIFVPTSGGQWVIQGAVTVKTAEMVGVTAQRGLLALSIGDHMGNLIAPFWAVIGAGIARVDFRLFYGYRLIFAALWFIIGVLAFTFLPC